MMRICLIVTISIVLSVQLAYSCDCIPPKAGGATCVFDGETNDGCSVTCAKLQKPCLKKCVQMYTQVLSNLRFRMQMEGETSCNQALQWCEQKGPCFMW